MSGEKLADIGNRIRIPKKASVVLSETSKAWFKCQFDHYVEPGYEIMSINTSEHPDLKRNFTDGEKRHLLRVFCEFIDTATGMTITAVNKKYGRKDDAMDFLDDFDGDGERVQIKHYSLGDSKLGRIARIHGFYNDRGVFVVRRLDWNHRYHGKEQR